MKTFDFALVFDHHAADDAVGKLLEACPDAISGVKAGQLWLTFSREAADINAAINEATEQCRAAGLPAPAFSSQDHARGGR